MIRRTALALAACAAILAAGCGGEGGGGGESDELANLAPSDAPLYLESVVRPEGEQRDAIDSLASRVGGIEDPGTLIVEQLDFLLTETGTDATYQADIAPWLGERAAVFVDSFAADPPFAAVFESTDNDAAEDFLKKGAASSPDTNEDSYKGVDYFWTSSSESGTVAVGVVGDFVVGGTLEGFKSAVDASEGDSLGDSSDFEDGVSAVSADNLGLGYVDSSEAIKGITASMSPPEAQVLGPLLAGLDTGPATFSVSATSDAAAVDVSLPSGSAGVPAGGDLVGKAPADAWFALGTEGLGDALRGAVDSVAVVPGVGSIDGELRAETGLDTQDLVSWMEGGYGFVAGTSEKSIEIGGIARSSDKKASADAIATLRKRFQADVDAKLGPPPRGADEGFSASAPESPQGIQVGQFGDEVVGALGPGQPAENALHPDKALADDPSFKASETALGSDFSPLAFVSLAPFFVVAEKGGQANDPDYLAAKPYLQKLDFLIVGTSSDDDRTTARFVVGVE